MRVCLLRAVLAINRYFDNPAFLNYLQYLKYWKQPQYAKYIVYVVACASGPLGFDQHQQLTHSFVRRSQVSALSGVPGHAGR